MKQFVCGECHGKQVVAHAMMSWDEHSEKFVMHGLTGSVWCEDCQEDRGFDFVNVEEWDEVIV